MKDKSINSKLRKCSEKQAVEKACSFKKYKKGYTNAVININNCIFKRNYKLAIL